MLARDVADKFLDEDGFANARTTEKTDLSAFGVWAKEVDDFDAGLKDVVRDLLFGEGWGWTVNWIVFLFREVSAKIVDWLAKDVEHTA